MYGYGSHAATVGELAAGAATAAEDREEMGKRTEARAMTQHRGAEIDRR